MTYILILISLLLPLMANAIEIDIQGVIVSGEQKKPIAGVKIDLLEPAIFSTQTTITNTQGEFNLHFNKPENINIYSRYITLRITKNGYLKLDTLHPCNLKSKQQCDLESVQLEKLKQPSNLSQQEQHDLSKLAANQGNSLFLIPFKVIPDDTPAQIDLELFAYALQSAINTRMQDLEEYLGVQVFDPLPPIELQTLTQSLAATDLAKRRSIGEYIKALAMISGISQWKSSQNNDPKINLYSDFLVMPSESGKSPRLLQVRDKELTPDTINSIELADQLSPLWGHFALLAIAGKEVTRATISGDNSTLERIRAYLIAEKATLEKNDSYKLNDLNRLLARIEQRLNQ